MFTDLSSSLGLMLGVCVYTHMHTHTHTLSFPSHAKYLFQVQGDTIRQLSHHSGQSLLSQTDLTVKNCKLV